MSTHRTVPPAARPLALATRAAMLTLALAGPTLPAPAFAAPSDAIAARPYRIGAGPLAASLNQFAASAGVALSFDPALAAGLDAPALQGSHSPASGFAALLAGSGLEAVDRGNGGYTLRKAAAEAAPTAAVQSMAPIRVSARREADNVTEGSGSYTTRSMNTATRMGLSMRETPQSVSIVTRQQMDDQALGNVPEILDKVPGVTVGRNDSERATFYARGYSIDNFQFDGVPNTLDTSAQYTTAIGDSAVYDRVEVVKGATGLLTGAGNPSATINLVRKRPTAEFAASLAASAGSWDKYRSVADVSGALDAGASVRARVVAAAQNAGSYIDYYKRATRNLYLIVEADLSASTLVSVGVDHMQSRADGVTFGHLPLFYSDGSQTHFRRSLNPGTRWSYWDSDSTNTFATLGHRFAQGWKLDATASHLRQSKDAIFGSAYNGAMNQQTGGGIRMLAGSLPTEARTSSANLALSGPFSAFGRTHEVMLGAGYSREVKQAELLNTVFTDVPDYRVWDGDLAQPASFAKRADRRTTITEKGVSAALRLRPAERWSVILGARASWYRLLDYQVNTKGARIVADKLGVGAEVVPYAGIVHELDKTWSVYASHTAIFKPQTYYKGADGAPLAPLDGKSSEAGVKGEFLDGRVNASVALFRIKQNNAPRYVAVNSATGEEIYRPVDGVTSEGMEAEMSGQLSAAWNLAAGYTYRTSKVPAQPDVILSAVNTNQPRHLLKLNTAYRLPGALSALVVGGSFAWQSETWYQTSDARRWRATQPGYALLGLMARYQVNPRLSVALNLNNVLDKTYMPGMGSYGTGVYGDKRSALATANFTF